MTLSQTQMEQKILANEQAISDIMSNSKQISNMTFTELIPFFKKIGYMEWNGYMVKKFDRENGDYTRLQNKDIIMGAGTLFDGEMVMKAANKDDALIESDFYEGVQYEL